MPNTFINLGFETAGAYPGYALGWTVAIVTTAEKLAAYQNLDDQPYEDFEAGWGGNEDYVEDFEPGDVIYAIYDVIAVQFLEDFEQEWAGGNQVHYTEMPGSVLAVYDLVPENKEDFEEEWAGGNQDDQDEFAPGDTTEAEYDVGLEAMEDFEEEWKSNENDVLEFNPGDTVTATYDAGQAFEDFEETDLRIATVEVTGEGVDGDLYTVKVAGYPCIYDYTGVGGLAGIRNQLVSIINAAQVGVTATADGVAAIKIRANIPNTSVPIAVETEGANAAMTVTVPDKTVYWTQTSELSI